MSVPHLMTAHSVVVNTLLTHKMMFISGGVMDKSVAHYDHEDLFSGNLECFMQISW